MYTLTKSTKTRRALAVILTALILLAALPLMPISARAAADDGSADYVWYGDGQADTFTISTPAELRGFANIVNGDGDGDADRFTGKTVNLTSDIELVEPWVPIGKPVIDYTTKPDEDNLFNGTFDGKGHEIRDMKIGTSETPESNNILSALFAELGIEGIIKNLAVTGEIHTEINTSQAAGLVSQCYGTIEDCWTDVDIYSTSTGFSMSAGFVNTLWDGGKISGSHSKGNLEGSGEVCQAGFVDTVGATLPYDAPKSLIYNCYSTGNVEGVTSGGFVRILQRGDILNCYSTGDVTGNVDSYNGGFVQFVENGMIRNCYSTGTVSGTTNDKMGTFAGSLQYAQGLVEGYSKNDDGNEGISAFAEGPDNSSNPKAKADIKGMALAEMKTEAFKDTLKKGAQKAASKETPLLDWTIDEPNNNDGLPYFGTDYVAPIKPTPPSPINPTPTVTPNDDGTYKADVPTGTPKNTPITFKPSNGETVDEGTVLRVTAPADKAGEYVGKSVVNEDGSISFIVPDGIEFEVVNNAKNFADVNDEWFADNVDFTSARELFSGTTDTTFSPNDPTTRAMFATVLWRLELKPDENGNMFDDTDPKAYYAAAALWAENSGVIEGIGNNKFAPKRNILRQELVAMMYRYAKYLGLELDESGDLSAFTDAEWVSEYAVPAMKWAVKAGIIEGENGKLDPRGEAKRCETAAMLQRFVEYLLAAK